MDILSQDIGKTNRAGAFNCLLLDSSNLDFLDKNSKPIPTNIDESSAISSLNADESSSIVHCFLSAILN